ncbi:MAG: hypothetical protein ABEK50_06905 [bacterium]
MLTTQRPTRQTLFYTLVGLIISVLMYCPAKQVKGAEAIVKKFGSYTAFPVSRYPVSDPNQTGNNNYYAMERQPGTDRVAVAASGGEDLLFHRNNSFTLSRMDPLLYHRDLHWNNRGTLMTAASRLPPDTGGVVMRFDRSDSRFKIVSKTPLNLQAFDFVKDYILAVGGRRFPNRQGAMFKLRDNQLETLTSPDTIVLHAVDWNPSQEVALIGGERGTVIEWTPPNNSNQIRLLGKPLIKTIAWHPTKDFALIAGSQGNLYRYRDGEVQQITTSFNWTIHDISWRPDGSGALLVGGSGGEDQGYWAYYEDFSIESHPLSKPLFSVEWIDEESALLGGQKVLWQLSRSVKPDKLGLEASLSSSRQTPDVGQSLTLSGFGSTYKANADSVTRYLFKYGTGDTSGWQTNPDNPMIYNQSGIYRPTLVVASKYSEGRATDRITIKVGDVKASSSQVFGWGALIVTLLLAIVLVVVLYSFRKQLFGMDQ